MPHRRRRRFRLHPNWTCQPKPTGRSLRQIPKTVEGRHHEILTECARYGSDFHPAKANYGLKMLLGSLFDYSIVTHDQAAIDVGPDPATNTPAETPKGLQKLTYNPEDVLATDYGTGILLRNQGTLRSSIEYNGVCNAQKRFSQSLEGGVETLICDGFCAVCHSDTNKAGVDSWEMFFRRQRRRAVQPVGGNRRVLEATEFYRLRIVCLR